MITNIVPVVQVSFRCMLLFCWSVSCECFFNLLSTRMQHYLQIFRDVLARWVRFLWEPFKSLVLFSLGFVVSVSIIWYADSLLLHPDILLLHIPSIVSRSCALAFLVFSRRPLAQILARSIVPQPCRCCTVASSPKSSSGYAFIVYRSARMLTLSVGCRDAFNSVKYGIPFCIYSLTNPPIS